MLTMILVSSSSSEFPTKPKPQEGEIAVQFVKIECPQLSRYTCSTNNAIKLDQLFEDPACKPQEYPVIYTEAGKTVTNDFRQSMNLVEDYNIVNSKPVPVEKPHQLGLLQVVSIGQIDHGIVDLDFKFSEHYLNGYHDISISEGQSVQIPKLSIRDFNTDITIALGRWCILGGLVARSDHDNETITYFLVRVMDSESTIEKKAIEIGKWYPKEFSPEH